MRELEGAFGDNDELSSLLATAVKADWLLLLTNVDGFLVPNGRKKPRLQRVVRKLTPAIEAQCNGKSSLGRGGMISKLRAAKLASEGGVHVAIVNGRHPQAITRGMQRKIGTYFPPQKVRHSKRDSDCHQLGFHAGKVVARARSSVPAGIAFDRGEERAAAGDRGCARSPRAERFSLRIAKMWKVPGSKARCATACC